MSDLVERLRNYAACTDADIDEAAAEIERLREQLVNAMEMLGDVPGETLDERLTKYIGSYMALQVQLVKEKRNDFYAGFMYYFGLQKLEDVDRIIREEEEAWQLYENGEYYLISEIDDLRKD